MQQDSKKKLNAKKYKVMHTGEESLNYPDPLWVSTLIVATQENDKHHFQQL